MATGTRDDSVRERLQESAYRPIVRFERPTPFHGSLNAAAACCPEEEQLARSLADEFTYSLALAAVGTENDERCCDDSVLATARRLVAKVDERKRAKMRSRAQDILAKDVRGQQLHFGSFAGPGARNRAGGPVLNRERRRLLEQAVRKRLEDQRAESSALRQFYISGGLSALLAERTTLDGVLSLELNEFFTERTLSQPEALNFRWSTECEEAEIGRWRVCRLPSRSVVASDSVGIGQILTVDFRQFLAPQPSPAPQHYEVTITPSTAPKITKQPGASPGSTITVKTPPEAVGLPSNAVRIAYATDTSKPSQFDEVTVFRRLEVHIDHLEMVEQQSGFGKDEYWLYGTVHEATGTENVKVFELPKRFALLPENDETPNIKLLNDSLSFALEYPSSSRWPKTYTVILTVLEEDGGGDIAEWMSLLWDAASVWLLRAVQEFVEDVLGLEGLPANASAATLAAISAALAGSVAGAIGGLVLTFAAGIVAMVGEAVADDYYGTRALILVLSTNTEDYVAELDGVYQPGGTYRMKARFPQFRYESKGSGLVQLRDGVVEVKLHWELKEPEKLLG